jgi:hypothetical protein
MRDNHATPELCLDPEADAALLALWDAFRAQWVRFEDADQTPEHDCPERVAAWNELQRLEAAIFAFPARTALGMSIKLRIIFWGLNESPEAADAMLSGVSPPDSVFVSDYDRELWRLAVGLGGLGNSLTGATARKCRSPRNKDLALRNSIV